MIELEMQRSMKMGELAVKEKEVALQEKEVAVKEKEVAVKQDDVRVKFFGYCLILVGVITGISFANSFRSDIQMISAAISQLPAAMESGRKSILHSIRLISVTAIACTAGFLGKAYGFVGHAAGLTL
jgi:hypothetical protein